MAVSIDIQHVKKQYEDNVVIRDLSAHINSGELFTLLGPSGCGKTTLLRMIAGFNSIEAGTISFDGQVINNIPVYQRNFGMVFQNYALFPNMTVWDNIAFGLRVQRPKLSEQEISRRVYDALELVALSTSVNVPVVGSFEGYLSNIVVEVAVESSHCQKMYSSQQSVMQNLETRRLSASGVSIDEEMVQMMKYQHAYAAASRLITALDEALDVLINKTGMVGR